jgi:hypothetical protein
LLTSEGPTNGSAVICQPFNRSSSNAGQYFINQTTFIDQGVGGMMGSEWILGRLALGGWGVDWIRLTQDRERSRAVESALMNLRVLAPRNSPIN